MWDNQEWVTKLGVFADRTTPQKSMLERAPEVLSDVGSSPISTMVEQVIHLVRNSFIPELDKFLDSNDNIPCLSLSSSLSLSLSDSLSPSLSLSLSLLPLSGIRIIHGLFQKCQEKRCWKPNV